VEKADYPVHALCRCLGVSRSGYYAWRQRPPSTRAQTDARLTRQLRVLHADSRGTYGRPRLQRALRHQGIAVGAKRIGRLMRAAGLRARGRRRFRVTTGHRRSDRVAPNHLRRRFVPARLNAAWAGDITACWTREGWSYLAIVMDLTSRHIVGWALERTLDTTVVIRALQRALLVRAPHRPRLFHSDQGTQYASEAFGQVLAQRGITASMSRRGNCWDNAPIESFFSTLKAEAWPAHPWPDVATARAAITSYIDDFYNRRRLHSALNYQSPVHYEQQVRTAV
jgi:putative transposase